MKSSPPNQPALIWITGLPGAGKSTLARAVFDRIKNERPSIYMDGDIFREIMSNDLGFSPEDRKKNAWRLVRMNKYLVQHGITVVCATVSLYKEIHDFNRENFPNYVEVLLDVPKKTLHERDQKNLYSKSKTGEENELIGIHQEFDMPTSPHVIIKNESDLNSLLSHTDTILNFLSS